MSKRSVRQLMESGAAETRKDLFTRVNNVYQIATGAMVMAQQIRNGVRHWRTYSITVRSDDLLYRDVHAWVLTVLPERKRKQLVAYTEMGYDRLSYDIDDEPEKVQPRLGLSLDDDHDLTIRVKGHKIKVSVSKPESPLMQGQMIRSRPEETIFSAQSEAGQQAVADELNRMLRERVNKVRKPVLWMLSSHGSWGKRSDLPLRKLDSVVLPPGQLETLRDDLAGFLDAEHEYNRRGIPWHRGYLFYGPPGNGKTSLAKALATEFGLDLWYVPLGDLDKDTSLLTLLSEVHPRSILLLEDIDSFVAATQRESEERQLSMSGLLNALDGVGTPHGMITIMTTNHRDHIDSAVLRSGRIDRQTEIIPPGSDEAVRLFEFFYGQSPKDKIDPNRRSVSDLTEIFKRNMDDPDAAEADLTTDGS